MYGFLFSCKLLYDKIYNILPCIILGKYVYTSFIHRRHSKYVWLGSLLEKEDISQGVELGLIGECLYGPQ